MASVRIMVPGAIIFEKEGFIVTVQNPHSF